MVGQAVSHYRVLSKLGSGGMGVVYEAEDTALGRRVALKFLPPELVGDSQALERFQREARAASALNHPSICTVYAIEQHERQHFIAMELLEGQSLLDFASSQPVPIADVVSIGMQVADALESAHARGIVHRDIKPGNIFITARKQVKILDFGLAKMDGVRLKATAAAQEETVAPNSGELTHPGMALGTISYMSPEQARGQLTDARSDLFSLGTVLYQLATGVLPFQGDTSAVVFEAILNRNPQSPAQIDPKLPTAFARIIEKALEKNRDLRYQSATDLKTDLARLKRDLESGQQPAAEVSGKAQPKSIAVLYFQNLSGAADDEYFRDGITEDIITELSKIKGLNVFSRPTVLGFRDKQVTPTQIGQQLRADSVLTGTVRRAGNRLRITAQLVDTQTDFQLWSERYDRELQDVFEVQDEIATKIAAALRVTLTPQEQEAIASKPTENLQAYDLYLRGKSYARRYTRQDLEFALQMFENAVKLDAHFALAYAAMANVYAYHHLSHGRDPIWMQRAVESSRQASALRPDLPEVQVGNAWVLYADKRYDEAVAIVRIALDRKKDTEGAYYLLGRALFAAGRYQEIANVAETALEFAGNDYNIYTPIMNALSALGKTDMLRNIRLRRISALEGHLIQVPEDARARIHLAIMYAAMERADDAMREAAIATALRSNDATVLYNAACLYCTLKKKTEAMDALRRAHAVGFKDADWARRDPDLELLRDEAEFDQLYPRVAGAAGM
jgi:serine/threonine protein kinase/Tfp pilus assembly protein PilF